MDQRQTTSTSKILASLALALGLGVFGPAPAAAAPGMIGSPQTPEPLVAEAQIFKRGRPPIYPYYYSPPRYPGGWSFYFGPVPYAKGDYEVQALQRRYPEMNWPPSMRYWTPKSQF